MKANRWLCLLLAICLVFTLAACGGGGGGSGSDDPSGGGGGGGGPEEPVIPPSDNYLCFTANADSCSISTNIIGSLTTTPSLEYSTDKENWEPFIINATTVDLANTGNKIYIRATNSNASFSGSEGWISFVISGSVSASGNIMSLLEKYCRTLSVPAYAFRFLFNCCSLTTAPELPATNLAESCYRSMFMFCDHLTTAPELPATTLAESCYASMFICCDHLTTAPELPATTLVKSCYNSMFQSCSSLTTAPELPATTLAKTCYESMFNGCSSLTTAPALPAITLADSCYYSMFNGCYNLNSITVYFTTWNDATYNWVNGVSATGTFTCPSILPDEVDDAYKSKKPLGWTMVPF